MKPEQNYWVNYSHFIATCVSHEVEAVSSLWLSPLNSLSFMLFRYYVLLLTCSAVSCLIYSRSISVRGLSFWLVILNKKRSHLVEHNKFNSYTENLTQVCETWNYEKWASVCNVYFMCLSWSRVLRIDFRCLITDDLFRRYAQLYSNANYLQVFGIITLANWAYHFGLCLIIPYDTRWGKL